MNQTQLNSSEQQASESPKRTFILNSAISAILVAVALFAIEWSNHQSRQQLEVTRVTEELAELRARLEFTIRQNLDLAQGITSYISINPDMTQQEFSEYASLLLTNKNQIRNIGAAKDLVLNLIHPVKGNEAVIGLDYRNNKAQSEAAMRAIEIGEIVLAGPLQLIQGGTGIIGRQPVYRADNNRLWGLMSVVMDYDKLLVDARLDKLGNLNIAIRGRDAKGTAGDVFFGDAALFQSSPAQLKVTLPHGSWVLAAEPVEGWSRFQLTPLLWLTAAVLMFFWMRILQLNYKTQSLQQRSLMSNLANAEQFKDVFEEHDAVMLLIDSLSGRIVDANKSALDFYGYPYNKLTGMKIQSINQLPPAKVEEAREEAARNQQNYFVFPQKLANGETRMVEVHSSPVETNGKFLLFSVIHDITTRLENEKKLKLDAAVFENSLEGIIITDKFQRIISVNRAFIEITGYSEAEVIGQNPSMLSAKKHDADFFTKVWDDINRTGHWKGEIWNRRKNGKIFPELLSINSVIDDDGQIEHYVGVFSDISQLKKSEEELENLALHDSLTGLPNRLSLRNTLDHAIAHASRVHERVAVLFLDLDQFKVVNDSLGHAAGDELLKAVSDRLSRRLRAQDTLGRLGGDEFVIILENLKSEKDIIAVAKDIIEIMNDPFPLSVRQEAYVGTSIGIAQFPDNADTGADLIAYADVAMYQAKQNGRNTYSFYNESLTANAEQQLRTFSQIKRGIEQQEFELYFQPQVDIDTGLIISAEALLRWNHPERGLLSPGAFIKIAEERGIIRDLSKYVLEKVCEQIRHWEVQGYSQTISVNISAQDFSHRDFFNEVRQMIETTSINPCHLELEITENTLMRKADSISKQMQAIRDLGINLAIDDFGTGYSSLAYLKHFPINKLKIDRSFVMDIDKDSADRAIISTIIDLAENFNLTVVAEGVELQSQQQYLQQEGCHLIQGYLYSKPIPAAEFEQMLDQQKHQRH